MANLLPYQVLPPASISSLAGNNPALVPAFQTLITALNLAQSYTAKVINTFLGGSGTALPAKGSFVGQMFFYTTTNKPAWWTGSGWVYADGTVA